MKKLFAVILLFAPFAMAQSIVVSPRGIVVNPLPTFEVETFLDKDPSGEGSPSYQIGESVRIGVRVSEDSFIYLYDVKSNGQITQILPNRFDAFGQNNFLRAGETKFFPPAGARYTFTIDPPRGLSKVIAVASKERLNTDPIASFGSDTNFARSNIGEDGFADAFGIVVQPVPQQDWVTDTALYFVGNSPVFPFGTLSISSRPSGARAFVDNQFVGFTPVARFGTRPGNHTVRLELDGYETFTATVNLPPGETVPVNAVLRQVRRTGTASFTSQPSNVQVFVDGRSVGTTPTGVITFEEGNHQARFSLAGFQDLLVNFTVASGSNQTINGVLRRALGTLTIQANVGGAQVFIDGSAAGTIPNGSGRLVINNLSTGKHELVVIAPQFSTFVSEFRIRAGETTEVRVRQSRR